jgi:hypothetical protein
MRIKMMRKILPTVTKTAIGIQIKTTLPRSLLAMVPKMTARQTRELAPMPFNTTTSNGSTSLPIAADLTIALNGSLTNMLVLNPRNHEKNKHHIRFVKNVLIKTSAHWRIESLPCTKAIVQVMQFPVNKSPPANRIKINERCYKI